jgi:hypothetical protein
MLEISGEPVDNLFMDNSMLSPKGTESLRSMVGLRPTTSPASLTKDSKHYMFESAFTFKPTKVGEFTIGPFEISYAGQVLQSKAIRITVLDSLPDDAALDILVDSNETSLDDPIKVIVIQKGPIQGNRIRLLQQELSEVWSITSASSVENSFSKGKMQSKQKTTYSLLPKRTGQFTIDSTLFSGLPQDYKFMPVQVLVKE